MVQIVQLDRFVPPHDPVLAQIAEPVKLDDLKLKVSADIQKCINEMFQVAYGEQNDKRRPLLVGLAAPQIGISKRIILVDLSADGAGSVGDLRLYINPEITWRSEEQNEWYEGCFSTSRVCGIVSRPSRIRIRAYTKAGDIIEEDYSGYTARIFQHEIDHLDGKEFVTHITDDEKLHWVEKEEMPEYRKAAAWRNWPRSCSREKWLRIKSGQE